tara:strand:+ start:30394 stop:31014 length:621 start_codon:yes stop_codon:yes gene_type:complete
MQHDLMNMFATPLYRATLGRAFTQGELDFFREALADCVDSISNLSTRDKNVLNNPALKDLRDTLQQHLDEYFKTIYNTSNRVSLKITQSWLTLSRQGDSHHSHTHPNSVVSGVLYINLAKNDGVSFHRNEDNLWHELLPAQENYFNAKSYFINTEVGDILLFPSHVRHGVREVTEAVERVSLSFNSFFEGELGKEEFATAINITLN